MRVLPLVALVLLLPTASACSLAYEPPEPARFTLVPHDGGAPIELAVGGRGLGADCGLSNPFLLSDGVFAWLESERNPARRAAVLYDIAGGGMQAVDLGSEAADSFGLWDGKLLYRHSEYSDAGSASTFYAHDIDTGEREALPFPDGDHPQVLFDGPRVIATLGTLLYVYDVSASEFVVEGRSLAEFSTNGAVWITAAGDGWMGIDGSEPLLYEIATGDTSPMGRGRPRAIADGYAYSWGWGEETLRRKIPDGPSEAFDTKGPVVGFVAGYTVLGEYSPPEAPRPTVPDEPVERMQLPPMGLLRLIFVFLAGPLGLLGALFSLAS